MRSAAAARRYARALYQLARDDDRVEAVRGEFEAMAALFDAEPALHRALFRPLHPVAERRAVLSRVAEQLGTSPVLRNFYALLVDQRRLIDFPAIREEYARLADEAAGRTRAEVVSASPLSDAQRERLRSALAARTGREIELSTRVDPTLIGGAVANVGTMVFDGSLRTQLVRLRSSLTKEH